MGYICIDGYMLRRFIINGANRLAERSEYVNSLNVFPVPDGDTGTNMSMTAMAAAREVEKLNSPNFSEVVKAASNGALRGARGNSGVILSQIFRGIYKGAEGKAVIDTEDFANCFIKAMETAYKAVMKPKEGTILTVIRALAEKAGEVAIDGDGIEVMLSEMVKYGNEVLAKTTDMLPQLKQAGVVDAGGQGLMLILEGGFENLGNENPLINSVGAGATQTIAVETAVENIKYGYCTEFFVNVENDRPDNQQELVSFLEEIGDSIVVVSDDEFIKVHVHTNNPGTVLERALKIGSLENIKIENMRLQHTNLISFTKKEEKPVEKKDYGFVAVSMGDGLKDIFTQMGADRVIQGGNTMNPSTEDILKAINEVNANTVFVLPNNKNIVMAAQQAAQLCEDKQVVVIPSSNIPQGISALVSFVSTNTTEENISSMTQAMEEVASGQVTYAVKDTVIDDREIKAGNCLCLFENKIIASEKNILDGTKKLIDAMLEANEDAEFVSVYYGQDANEEEAQQLADYIEEINSDAEVEVKFGGQPIYYYYISVE